MIVYLVIASHLSLQSKLYEQFYHQKFLDLSTLSSYEVGSHVGLNLPTAKMLSLKEKDAIFLFSFSKSVYPHQNSGNIKKINYFVTVLYICGNVVFLQLIFFFWCCFIWLCEW